MKIIKVFLATIFCVTLLGSCNSGIEYIPAPESVYSEVGLANGLAKIRVRELLVNKIWQVNHNDGKGQWLKEHIVQTQTSQGYQDGRDFINNTDADITIMGKVVKVGETMRVKNTIEEVEDSSAPGGKRYIAHIFSPAVALYETPNKGHLFVESAFENDPVKPLLIDPVDGKSTKMLLPVRQDALVVELILANEKACRVEPVNGAPTLGTPSDFTKPNQYMVINTSFRPDDVPEYRRLYEIKVQLLPGL
jgi:hypothetical protein